MVRNARRSETEQCSFEGTLKVAQSYELVVLESNGLCVVHCLCRKETGLKTVPFFPSLCMKYIKCYMANSRYDD